MATPVEQIKAEMFTHLSIIDKPYFEHEISFEGNQNEVHEEEAFHMIRLAKLTRLVENRADVELSQEVLEFVTFIKEDRIVYWYLGLVF